MEIIKYINNLSSCIVVLVLVLSALVTLAFAIKEALEVQQAFKIWKDS